MKQEAKSNPYFDAHTHAHFPGFGADRAQVMARAREVGVQMILVGTQISTSETAIQCAEEYKDLAWASVGFHPSHAIVDRPERSRRIVEDHPERNGGTNWYHDKNEQASPVAEQFDAEKFKKLAMNPRVVAIGECGLDYYRLETSDKQQETKSKQKQKEVFEAQIKIAKEVKKPLMIHCRNAPSTSSGHTAFSDLIDILSSRFSLLTPGVVHFFTGTAEDARMLLNLGFSFTFGGVITFSRDYDEVIKMIPLDRILSETDAPYVAPTPYRGKRNEPAYVVEVVKKLAEIKAVPVEEMREIIYKNAQRIFSIEI